MSKTLDFFLQIRAIDHASGVFRHVRENVERLNSSVKRTQHFREFGQNAMIMGAGVAGMGAGIALPLGEAVKQAGELNQALHNYADDLPNGANATLQMAKAQDLAARMSVKFNYSQSQVVETMRHVISMGGSLKDVNALTRDSLELARGGFGDANEAAENLLTTFNAFGVKGKPAVEQINRMNDQMAYLVRTKAFSSLTQLQDAMSESEGAAKAANIPLSSYLATLTAFQRVGIKGSMAGSAFEEMVDAIGRGGLQKLGVAVDFNKNGSINLLHTLANLGRAYNAHDLTFFQMQRVFKDLGERGAQSLLVAAKYAEKLNHQLAGAAINGAALRGAHAVMAGFEMQMGRLHKAIELVAAAIGKPLLKPLEHLATSLVGVAKSINSFAKANPVFMKWAVEIAAVSSAILVAAGTFGMFIGAMSFGLSYIPAVVSTLVWLADSLSVVSVVTKLATAAQWLFNAALDGNPIGLAVVAAVALAGAGYEIYENWSKIGHMFEQLGLDMLFLLGPFGILVREIIENFGAIKKAIESIPGFHWLMSWFEGSHKIAHHATVTHAIAGATPPAAVRHMGAAMATPGATGAPALGALYHGGATVHQTNHVNVTVNGPGDEKTISKAVLDTLHSHAHEVAGVVNKQNAQYGRTVY